jgi:hypothetical protein
VAALAQQLGRRAHDARHVPGGVDDGVPRTTREGVETAVAVALKALGLREQLRVRLAAREDRHLVTATERLLDDGATEELRPAEDEQPHSLASAARSPSTSAAVL